MRLKKKCVLVCTFAIALVYIFACTYLLGKLDPLKQNLEHIVQARGYSPEKLDLVHQLIKSDCSCKRVNVRTEHGGGRQGPQSRAVRIQTLTPDKQICDRIIDEINTQHVDIQVAELYSGLQLRYHHLTFVHRGWVPDLLDVAYLPWNQKPLEVFVVPFSHVDPGWLETVSTYYDRASLALSLATRYLSSNARLTFVWSEVVYLKQWYELQTPTVQTRFRGLVASKRFEILTGGWVMTDEAVAHYGAMLEQLIEGHQWLKQVLNHTVSNAWSIDAFGVSGTMPYLLKRSGVNNLLIQRVHYNIKRALATNKQLEFLWRQTWDPGSTTDIYTHVPPFLLYNTLHNCGPDPEICCQFDFSKKNCFNAGEYHQPESITLDNIKQKAQLLLEQLQKKAQFYEHNKLLMLYGDDFRYHKRGEWESLQDNLLRLMDYMNADKQMNIKLTFSTLGDYFAASQPSMDTRIPTLSGDFLSYTDRADQYWSGYYTSRPFLKDMTRRLQHRLRSADILYSLMASHSNNHRDDITLHIVTQMYRDLRTAHEVDGLLQHHDAITGTARHHVVKDYLKRLRDGFRLANHISERSLSYLLEKNVNYTNALHTDLFVKTEYQDSDVRYPLQEALGIGEHIIAVFNSLPSRREVYTTVTVKHPYIEVKAIDGKLRPCQINPVLDYDGKISTKKYKVVYVTELEPLEVARFQVKSVNEASNSRCLLSKIKVTSVIHHHDESSVFDVEWAGLKVFTLQSPLLEVHFCGCTGLVQNVVTKDNLIPHQSEISFVKYGTGSWTNPLEDKSGAYTFVPNGPAMEIEVRRPEIMVLEGPLVNEVQTKLPLVTHQVAIYNTEGPLGAAVHIENTVDISANNNTEVAMRVHSDISSKNIFYTDINGFQIQKRKRLPQYKIQGNYYPITSQIYVEDHLFRMSLLTASSRGASSLQAGDVETMLDRRLAQDDWRGLSQGVLDNVPTSSRFMLLWETRQTPWKHEQASSPLGHASVLSHQMSFYLDHEPEVFHQTRAAPLSPTSFQPLATTLPADVVLVNLRTFREPRKKLDTETLFLVHRVTFDCDFVAGYQHLQLSDGKLSLDAVFSNLHIVKASSVSLTGVHTLKTVNTGHGAASLIDLPLMEIKAFKLTLLEK